MGYLVMPHVYCLVILCVGLSGAEELPLLCVCQGETSGRAQTGSSMKANLVIDEVASLEFHSSQGQKYPRHSSLDYE